MHIKIKYTCTYSVYVETMSIQNENKDMKLCNKTQNNHVLNNTCAPVSYIYATIELNQDIGIQTNIYNVQIINVYTRRLSRHLVTFTSIVLNKFSNISFCSFTQFTSQTTTCTTILAECRWVCIISYTVWLINRKTGTPK